MLVGPLVLLIYEPLIGGGALARRRAASSCASACSACWPRSGGSCRWSCTPSYGIDFLQFTEQPRAIWATNSAHRGAAPDGVLDLVLGRRASTAPTAPLFSEAGDAAVQPASSWAPRCSCPRWRWPASSGRRRWRYAPVLPAAPARRRGDRGGRVPERDAGRGTRWSGSTATCRCCASCAPPRRRRRWSPIGRGRAARHRRADRLGAPARAASPARSAARAGWRGARPRGADRARRAAARARHGASRSSSPGTASPRPGPTPGTTSTASCRATRARWCCRARSSPTTTGAARSTRSCRASPTARWPCATRRPTPTRTPPTCSRRSTGWCSSGACCPGQLLPLLRLMGVRRGGHRQRRRHRRAAARSTPRAAAGQLDGQGLDRPSRTLRARCAPCRPREGRHRAARDRCPQVRRYDLPRRARARARRSRPARRRSSTAPREGLAGMAAFGALPRAPADPLRGRPVRRPSCSARPRGARTWS